MTRRRSLKARSVGLDIDLVWAECAEHSRPDEALALAYAELDVVRPERDAPAA